MSHCLKQQQDKKELLIQQKINFSRLANFTMKNYQGHNNISCTEGTRSDITRASEMKIITKLTFLKRKFLRENVYSQGIFQITLVKK